MALSNYINLWLMITALPPIWPTSNCRWSPCTLKLSTCHIRSALHRRRRLTLSVRVATVKHKAYRRLQSSIHCRDRGVLRGHHFRLLRCARRSIRGGAARHENILIYGADGTIVTVGGLTHSASTIFVVQQDCTRRPCTPTAISQSRVSGLLRS